MSEPDREPADLAQIEDFLRKYPRNPSELPLPGGDVAIVISEERYQDLIETEQEFARQVAGTSDDLSEDEILAMLKDQVKNLEGELEKETDEDPRGK